jgi:hypothetical protein
VGTETLFVLSIAAILLGLAGYLAWRARRHWGATCLPGDDRDITVFLIFSLLAGAAAMGALSIIASLAFLN